MFDNILLVGMGLIALVVFMGIFAEMLADRRAERRHKYEKED